VSETYGEITSQAGGSGHRKSNSCIEAAPKCRPAHSKERGVRLGNQAQADANKAAAAARDADLRPILEAMRGQPLRPIPEELTDRGVKTPRGGDTWNQVTVMRSMRRLGIRK
jgi:hypothetical protein